jgi:KDO2-lipid IV(A) lauroyltransferase
MIREIKHIFEAIFVYALYGFFKVIPYEIASSIGGFVGRTFGSFTKANEVAKKNLKLIFPEMDNRETKKILKGMWDNLGRTAAELPHIASMPDGMFDKYVEIKNAPENMKGGALLVSAHYGNFELAARAIKNMGIPIYLVHRPANNLLVNNLINNVRRRHKAKLIAKGVTGVRRMLQALKEGDSVGMLIDQKINTGIDVPFLGHVARTTPLPATLIKKYNVPVYFLKMHRKKSCYFEVTISDPLMYKKTETSEEIMSKMNNILEEWIKTSPEQWFWVHKRWGKL